VHFPYALHRVLPQSMIQFLADAAAAKARSQLSARAVVQRVLQQCTNAGARNTVLSLSGGTLFDISLGSTR